MTKVIRIKTGDVGKDGTACRSQSRSIAICSLSLVAGVVTGGGGKATTTKT
jgi:hypothetical protein